MHDIAIECHIVILVCFVVIVPHLPSNKTSYLSNDALNFMLKVEFYNSLWLTAKWYGMTSIIKDPITGLHPEVVYT